MSRRDAIRRRTAPWRRIAVWGTGSEAAKALALWLPRDKVAVLVDSNPERQGRTLYGLPVIGPAALAGTEIDAIVVCSTAYVEIIDALRAAGDDRPALHVYQLLADGTTESELARLALDLAVQKDRNWIDFLVVRPQVLVNVTFRLGRWLKPVRWAFPLYYAVKILHAVISAFFGITLPLTVRAGAGLIFQHYGSIIVHPQARLGTFVTLYQCTTIGSDDGGGVPELGDGVVLYKGSAVLGGCRVGAHARIGAHALVLAADVPPRSTMVGTPARVVRTYRGDDA